MKKYRILITFILFLLINVFIISSYLYYKNSKLKEIEQDTIKEPFAIYNLQPLFSPTNINGDQLPFVKTPPSDIKYILVDFKEQFDLKKNKTDKLLLAAKRISEMEKWGKEFTLIRNYKNIDQIQYWWDFRKPTLFEFKIYGNYNTWESTFARYINLISEDVKELQSEGSPIEKKIKLHYLRNTLQNHRSEMKDIINRLNKPNEDSKYLQDTVDDIFFSLDNLLGVAISNEQYDPFIIDYSIDTSIRNNDPGVYDIKIEKIGILNEFSNDLILDINDKTYHPTSYATMKTTNDIIKFPRVFENININKNTNTVTLTLPKINLINNLIWHQTREHKNYKYYANLNMPNGKRKYILEVDYQLDQSLIFSYGNSYKQTVFNKIKNKNVTKTLTNYFSNRQLFSDTKINRFQQYFEYNTQEQNLPTRFSLISEKPLSEESLSNIKISLFPIYEPTLILEKTSNFQENEPSIKYIPIKNNFYQIVVKNSTNLKDAYILNSLNEDWKVTSKKSINESTYVLDVKKWKDQFILYIFFIINFLYLAIYFFVINRYYKHLLTCNKIQSIIKIDNSIKLIHAFFLRAKNNINHYIELHKYKIFLLAFSGIFIYLLIIEETNPEFSNRYLPMIISLILWIITIIIYRVEPRLNLLLSLVFLSVTPFILLLENGMGILAEKTAIWAYLFLSIGLIQIIFSRFKQKEYLSMEEFSKSIYKSSHELICNTINHIPPVVKYFSFIIFEEFKIIIVAIYGPRPKTKKDYIALSKRVLITFILFLITTTFLFFINNKAVKLSLNPDIFNIEPKIVYYSNTVIINGYGLTWNESGQTHLMNQYGEITADFWSDNKIIFTVPLHWPTGPLNIWVEKPISWDGKTIKAKSNIVNLKLIPRSRTLTPDDDAYFKQLKYLDEDLLKLNGYDY